MPNNVPLQLKDTLRSLRIKFGYKQDEMAKILGVHVQTLRAWEVDSSEISYSMIKKIEEIFGIPQDYIFFGRQDAFSERLKQGQTA